MTTIQKLALSSVLSVLVLSMALYGWLTPATPLSAQSGGAPVVCSNFAVIDSASAATAELVALAAGQRVYVCGFVLSAGGTTTANFVAGTGTDCATGQEDLHGALEFADNDTVSWGSGVGWVFRTDTADALCWTNDQAIQVSGVVTYTQF